MARGAFYCLAVTMLTSPVGTGDVLFPHVFEGGVSSFGGIPIGVHPESKICISNICGKRGQAPFAVIFRLDKVYPIGYIV